MPNADRAAVAREATLQLVNEFSDHEDAAVALTRAQQEHMRRYIGIEYPAPAAPETVTVEGYSLSPVVREKDLWREANGYTWRDDNSTGRAPLFARIAADARRIAAQAKANTALIDERNTAELERDEARRLYAESEAARVEARRAIENLKDRAAIGDRDARVVLAAHVQVATSQGEGLVLADTNSEDLSPSPAPIPLDAAINWLMGCNGRFEASPENLNPRAPYWWRSDFARRAGLRYDVERGVYVVPSPVADAATSQGEGHEAGVSAATCGGSGPTQPVSSNTGESSAAAPSPAPIPLGAVVNDGRRAWRHTEDDGDPHWVYVSANGCDDRSVFYGESHFDALCAFYRALHPVADAATVKRVALRVKQYNGPAAVSAEGFARIILTELGYTIQEGA